MSRSKLATNSRWLITFQSGDPKALMLAIKKNYRQLRTLVLCYLPDDSSLAKEIVLRTFGKAWERRSRFKNPEHFQKFLYVTTRNKCIDYLRKNKKRKKAEMGYMSATDAIENVSPHEWEKEYSFLIDSIYRHLNNIRHGEVIRMAYFENKSTEDIAAFLKTSRDNVYTIKTRALAALRESLFTAQ